MKNFKTYMVIFEDGSSIVIEEVSKKAARSFAEFGWGYKVKKVELMYPGIISIGGLA